MQAHAFVQVDMSPTAEVKRLLQRLCGGHTFYIVSGRVVREMQPWFGDVAAIGIAAEHGYYRKQPGSRDFVVQYPSLDFAWKELVRPIMMMYADSTDGSHVQEKDCGITWAYAAADPDFGRWQACVCTAPETCCCPHTSTCISRSTCTGLYYIAKCSACVLQSVCVSSAR